MALPVRADIRRGLGRRGGYGAARAIGHSCFVPAEDVEKLMKIQPRLAGVESEDRRALQEGRLPDAGSPKLCAERLGPAGKGE